MTRSILRIVLTTLAFVMLFAGSLNLNRTSANQPGPGQCQSICGCPGGPQLCCTIFLPGGTQANCGMPF
jgi:hypothetical protein